MGGFHPDTLKGWLTRGAKDPTGLTPEGGLWARIAAAMAEAEAIDVARMNRAAAKDWRAASWLLERRWPERWSLKLQAQVQAVPGPDGTLASWNLAVLSPQQLLALLEIARQAAGEAQVAALTGAASNGHDGNGGGPQEGGWGGPGGGGGGGARAGTGRRGPLN